MQRDFSPITQDGANGTAHPVWAHHLYAIEVSIGARNTPRYLGRREFAVIKCLDQLFQLRRRDILDAVLDPPDRDLPVYRIIDLLLRLADLLGDLRPAAHDVERSPCQEGGHGVEIATVRFTAEPRRLEGDRAAAAEGVPDARHMAEASRSQLGHQLGQRGGAGSQMAVDDLPGFGGGAVNLFRAVAVFEPLVVQDAQEDPFLKVLPLLLGDPLLESGLLFIRFRRKIAAARRGRKAFEKLLDGNALRLATQEAFLVHGHEAQEDLAVHFRIVGGGEEQPKDGGAAKDERFSAPPLSEAGERLAVVRLPLLVAFHGHLGDGELGLDEAQIPDGHGWRFRCGKRGAVRIGSAHRLASLLRETLRMCAKPPEHCGSSTVIPAKAGIQSVASGPRLSPG